MAERGGGRFGSDTVRIPAEFRGTARLVGPDEPPAQPPPIRFDDVEGVFEAELELSFPFLLGLGFEPVHPSHPAWPRYLAASSEPAASPEPEPASFDPHDPDLIVMPFETVIQIPDDAAIAFGLVPPGHPATRAPAAPVAAPARRKPRPPPWHKPLTGTPTAPDPLGHLHSFDAFMHSLGEPEAGEEHAVEKGSPATIAEEDRA